MARTKSIPDADILANVRRMLLDGGEKSVSFGTVATATGLAPATLVQRYGSREDMVRTALLMGWDALQAATTAALSSSEGKGALAVLKALDASASQAQGLMAAGCRDEVAMARATEWRLAVQAALATRIGSGEKAREAAALLFAAWQGQAAWKSGDFRLKDTVKRLT